MIIGMVTCMSLFGLLMEGKTLSLSAYFQACTELYCCPSLSIADCRSFSRMILTNY